MIWAQLEAFQDKGPYPRLPRVFGRRAEPEAPIPEVSHLDPKLEFFQKLRGYERLQDRQLKELATKSISRITTIADSDDNRNRRPSSDLSDEEAAWGIAQADFEDIAQELRKLLVDLAPIPIIPDSRLGPLTLSRKPCA